MTATCADCLIRLTSANRAESHDSGLCAYCFDAAGQENDHSDNGHAEPQPNCRECGTYVSPNPKHRAATAGPKSHTSHKGHAHPATKAARAACRKGRQAPTAAPARQVILVDQPAIYLTHDSSPKTKHSFLVGGMPGHGLSTTTGYATKVKGADYFSSSPLARA